MLGMGPVGTRVAGRSMSRDVVPMGAFYMKGCTAESSTSLRLRLPFCNELLEVEVRVFRVGDD